MEERSLTAIQENVRGRVSSDGSQNHWNAHGVERQNAAFLPYPSICSLSADAGIYWDRYRPGHHEML